MELYSSVRSGLVKGLVELGLFSFFINILLLVQPLYMLQVYDRVLPSSNESTLLYLSLISVAAMLVLALLDIFRQQYANRLANRLEVAYGADAFLATANGPRAELGDVQTMRDLATARNFLGSRILLGLFDVPFVPLFIFILLFIHVDIFLLTLAGVLLITFLAWMNHHFARATGQASAEATIRATSEAQAFAQSSETIRAMGMTRNVIGIWGKQQALALKSNDDNSTINAWFGGLSRFVRQVLQIAIMGLGAYLVLEGEMTAGMIFATSMISSRALQPIDQLIGSWRMIQDARMAWVRFKNAARSLESAKEPKTDLPAPIGHIAAEDLTWLPRSRQMGEPIIKRLTFQIPAGSTLGLVGPSGAGKSTLAKLLCGALEPVQGRVRIDRAEIRQWDRDKLGKHIGYLSQSAELLPGTIAQNISRFDPDASDEDIVAAAQKAQVHQLILSLPGGYGALLGPNGLTLSGGQRQRVGLARAFFGNPKIIILDEPNANLDVDGEAALDRAIQQAKDDGITLVMVTQRRNSADKLDNLMVLKAGSIEDYGPRHEVIERQTAKIRETMNRQQQASKPQQQGFQGGYSVTMPKIGGDKLQ